MARPIRHLAIVILALAWSLPAADVSNAAARTVTVVGAGDIAICGLPFDERTANLLDGETGTVLALGDNAYESGTKWQFIHCYGPSWGRHRHRTRPAPGNHEYGTPGAAGYFAYFAGRAGKPGQGWYAYNSGAWRIYVLNSNCAEVGGCWVGSRQERWLRADLAAHPRDCVLAYWHHPYFSSGVNGNTPGVRGLWKALLAADADVVLNGHDHDYERFAPQDWLGRPTTNGIRQFVVGTGGAELRAFETVRANSQERHAGSHGVLRLRLGDGFYRWRFVAAGTSYADNGAASCH